MLYAAPHSAAMGGAGGKSSAAPLRGRAAVRCDLGPDERLRGALILAIAGVWIAVPLLALGDGRAALPGLGVAGSCSLVAAGFAQLLWALHLLLRRRTLSIDESALHLTERGLLGVRCRREPRAAIRGLRHRRERIGWRVVHRLELVHAEPAKAICLLSTHDERHLAAAARRWGQWLGLPAAVSEPWDALS